MKHHFTKSVKFGFTWSIQKLRFYTNMRDQIPKLMKFYAVNLFNCPGCSDSYIGKTGCTLWTRTDEHDFGDYNYIDNCSYYGYIQNLFHFNNDSFDKILSSINLVQSNTKVIFCS